MLKSSKYNFVLYYLGASFGDALLGLSETQKKSKRKQLQVTPQEKPCNSKRNTLSKEKKSNKPETKSTPSSSLQTKPYNREVRISLDDSLRS